MCLVPPVFFGEEYSMEFAEIIIAVGAFGLAAWYLYRKIVVTKGCSCGKSGCCSTGNDKLCSVDQKESCKDSV